MDTNCDLFAVCGASFVMHHFISDVIIDIHAYV